MNVPSAIESARNEGREDIVRFLNRGGKNESYVGNACRIDVGLLYHNRMRPVVQNYYGEFVVKNINDKSFKRKVRGHVTVLRGEYVIEILNSNMHGRSNIVN